jgi:hypothetical protein
MKQNIDWDSLYKATQDLSPAVEAEINAWHKQYPRWDVWYFVDQYPPSFQFIVSLKPKNERSKEEYITIDYEGSDGKAYTETRFVAHNLTDDDLDDLTPIITTLVNKFDLLCFRNKPRFASIIYRLSLKRDNYITKNT